MINNTVKKRAVLYMRLSDSTDESTSIVRQRKDLVEHCEREGWDVVKEFVDDGKSGGKKRANAEEAMRMLADREADVLVSWKTDRYSRQGMRVVGQVEDALNANPSGLFISIKDGIRSDVESWRIQMGVMAEMARAERAATIIRTDSSMKYLRSVGRYSGGNVPYGYRVADDPNSKGRVLEIDPNEAAEVRKMADMILVDKVSLYSVMQDLNARGVLTRSSTIVRDRLANNKPVGRRKETKWSLKALRLLLTSDVIAGLVWHRDSKKVAEMGGKRSLVDAELLRGEDGLPLQQWPPVLSIETVKALRLKLKPERLPGTIRRRKHDARLLSGLVRCAECGNPLYPRVASKTGVASYDCSSRGNGVPCSGCSIHADRLEGFVTAAFLDRFGDFMRMEIVETGATEIEAARVAQAINEVTDLMRIPGADIMTLSAQLQNLVIEREEIGMSKPATEWRATGETWAQAWENGDTAVRRELLIPNIESLTIKKGVKGRNGPLDPNRVVLEWRPPDQVNERNLRLKMGRR